LPRPKLLYEDVVDGIRDRNVQWRFRNAVSDDTDAWFEGSYGHSPNNERMASNMAGVREADRMVLELIEVGAAAGPAVAKGLRMQGRWREHLLPFASRFSSLPEVRDALELVARRKRDPVRWDARCILDEG